MSLENIVSACELLTVAVETLAAQSANAGLGVTGYITRTKEELAAARADLTPPVQNGATGA